MSADVPVVIEGVTQPSRTGKVSTGSNPFCGYSVSSLRFIISRLTDFKIVS